VLPLGGAPTGAVGPPSSGLHQISLSGPAQHTAVSPPARPTPVCAPAPPSTSGTGLAHSLFASSTVPLTAFCWSGAST
jgi:hypothetical protein